jgi:hypothetical protein
MQKSTYDKQYDYEEEKFEGVDLNFKDTEAIEGGKELRIE